MQAPSLIGIFVAPLNRAGIDYMVTGGLAAVVYGHPRLTLDVDLVIRLSATDAVVFAALWPANEFCSPPAEVIKVSAADVDRQTLEHWIARLQLDAEWTKAQAYVGRE